MSDSKTAVEVYEAQIAALRMENEQLRRSAQAFGELADRLNRALQTAKATSSAVEPPVLNRACVRGTGEARVERGNRERLGVGLSVHAPPVV